MEKIVFISGNFNVLHPGHIRLLKFAKEFGGKLIVGVNSDKLAGSDAHISELLRIESIKSIGLIDDAFLIKTSIEDILEKLKPDIVIKGKEYENKFNSESIILNKYGGKLVFTSGEITFSSVDLIKREIKGTPINSIRFPLEYLKRNLINDVLLRQKILEFTFLKVCVIGDIIIDDYINCEPLGMSQEDPTIVVSPINSNRFLGGAGIVAAHASGLGAQVNLISVIGDDEPGKYANTELNKFGVDATILIDETRPTTLKQRYRCKGKTLLRVSHLHQSGISIVLQDNIYKKLTEIINKIDLIVFSDFNYGVLPQGLVERITKLAIENDKFIVADSQSSSQVGDIGRFKNMNLITPTEREARIATRNQEDGLIILSEKLKTISRAKNILLKLGEDGLIVHSNNIEKKEWHTDQIDALNIMPKDVAGAGDSLLITTALSLVSGLNIWESSYLGSLAAAIQVSRVGNVPLQALELIGELKR